MRQGLDEDLYTAVAEYREHPAFTERERLAIEYAERFALAHTGVDAVFMDQLRLQFSDCEVLELTALNALCVGLGRALTVLDVERDFDVLWSREPESSTP